MNILQYMTSGEAAGEMYVYMYNMFVCKFHRSAYRCWHASTKRSDQMGVYTLLQILFHRLRLWQCAGVRSLHAQLIWWTIKMINIFCHKNSSGTQNLKICISNEFKEKQGGGGRNSFADIVYIPVNKICSALFCGQVNKLPPLRIPWELFRSLFAD